MDLLADLAHQLLLLGRVQGGGGLRQVLLDRLGGETGQVEGVVGHDLAAELGDGVAVDPEGGRRLRLVQLGRVAVVGLRVAFVDGDLHPHLGELLGHQLGRGDHARHDVGCDDCEGRDPLLREDTLSLLLVGHSLGHVLRVVVVALAEHVVGDLTGGSQDGVDQLVPVHGEFRGPPRLRVVEGRDAGVEGQLQGGCGFQGGFGHLDVGSPGQGREGGGVEAGGEVDLAGAQGVGLGRGVGDRHHRDLRDGRGAVPVLVVGVQLVAGAGIPLVDDEGAGADAGELALRGDGGEHSQRGFEEIGGGFLQLQRRRRPGCAGGLEVDVGVQTGVAG